MGGARFLSGLLLGCIASIPAVAIASNQVVDNCSNDTELRTDLAIMQFSGGGTMTFSCEPSTIVLTGDMPPILTATTIDGGGKIEIDAAHARRIFTVDAAASLTLQKIVLQGGQTSGDGGAISSNGPLTLKEVTIRNSLAGLSGGAFVAYGPTLIEDSDLHSNHADNGGAVYARFSNASVVIRRTSIHFNYADDLYGGGVFLWDGASVTIEDSVVSNNQAHLAGGNVYNAFSNSSVTITRSKVTNGLAQLGSGGGIFIEAGPLSITDSEISGNTGRDGGGLHYANGSNLTIFGSTFAGNYAELSYGGAIYIENATGVSVTNSTIGDSQAQAFSAIYAPQSAVALVHVTLANNDANDKIGSVYHSAINGRTMTLKGVLSAGNIDPNFGTNTDTFVSFDGNVSDDASGAPWLTGDHDQNNAVTKLGPLGLNGGLTPTCVPQPGSDAVDTGVFSPALAIDQRGSDRLQGQSVDAGAVEVATCGEPPLCGDANENGSIAAGDALKALRTAVGSDTCALRLCDYDGNEKVTAADALNILRASVGQPTSPSCPAWDCHT